MEERETRFIRRFPTKAEKKTSFLGTEETRKPKRNTFSEAVRLKPCENMSASAAKVSKKELNSNHDGADETSGKEWRRPAHRHFFLTVLGL